MDDQNQLRVAWYLRVSTDEQVEKYVLDLQRTSLIGAMQSKGVLEDGEILNLLVEILNRVQDDGVCRLRITKGAAKKSFSFASSHLVVRLR